MKTLVIVQATFFLIGLHAKEAMAEKTSINPEKEAAYLGKQLKPIPDEEWKAIAGIRITEQYKVEKGDTLYEISKRMFGDPKYWPKVWALNNASITNPHHLKAGILIAFSTGTGNSLPDVSIHGLTSQKTELDSSSSDSHEDPDGSQFPIPSKKRSGRSTDWKYLPKQSWESIKIEIPAGVDPLGFDEKSKLNLNHKNHGFEPQSIPATEKMRLLGQIVGSRSEGEYLGLNDTIYVRADESIQIGETYAITREPGILKSSKSDRIGYSYPVLGKLKILGVRDHLFIGMIISAKDFISRGSSIIQNPPKITEISPIPASKSVQGIVMVDHYFSTSTIAQHKELYIDRGTDDGVKPGMIFRVYQHFDPSNRRKLTNSDFIIDADVIVTQVSETFCSGWVLQSRSPISENAKAVLLTDVSDILKSREFTEKSGEVDERETDELDELDKLDTQESVGKDEKRELKQLELWKGNTTPKDNENNPSENNAVTPPPPAPETPLLENTADLPPAPPPAPEGISTPSPSSSNPPSEISTQPPTPSPSLEISPSLPAEDKRTPQSEPSHTLESEPLGTAAPSDPLATPTAAPNGTEDIPPPTLDDPTPPIPPPAN